MRGRLSRALLPAGIVALTMATHCVWLVIHPQEAPFQARWATPPTTRTSALAGYIDAGDYWLGLSYAVSLAFAAIAFRRYREEQSCASRNVAVAGLTISGFVAVAGCFLVGCCGSPMLAVYLNLLGARFLPFARPLVTLATTVSCVLAWYWLDGRQRCGPSVMGCGPQCAQDPTGLCPPPPASSARLHPSP